MKIKTDTNMFVQLFAGALLCLPLAVMAEDIAAQIDWAEQHYASVPVDGFVESVLVQEGQRVNKGDKLLELNTTVLTAKVKQSRAQLAAQKPLAADAAREYRDAQALYEQTVLSDVELQRAKMNYDVAAAKQADAEAGHAINQALLARTSQYAPWDAWVISRRVETGQVIVGDERSKPLIVLARADQQVAHAEVSFDVQNRLSVGQALEVRYRDKSYNGQVQSIAQRSADKSIAGPYRLRVVFSASSAQKIRPGDAAIIVLP